MPHVSKDDLTESLFDSIGFDEEDLVTRIERASNELLYALIRKHPDNRQNLILESNFHPVRGLEKIEEALSAGHQEVVEIFLSASKPTILERFRRRWESGNRHPGHRDHRLVDALEKHLDGRPQPVSVSDKVISIDAEAAPEEVLDIALRELRAIEPSITEDL
jgi:hypothetical protein